MIIKELEQLESSDRFLDGISKDRTRHGKGFEQLGLGIGH